MKPDLFKKINLFFTLLVCMAGLAKAALITTVFADLDNNQEAIATRVAESSTVMLLLSALGLNAFMMNKNNISFSDNSQVPA